ncbi:MAG: glutathione S-transferase family protein [Oligoflexia bacterium]|nr:glutathione S-transferase family protein [Oligoflexia bacterium]
MEKNSESAFGYKFQGDEFTRPGARFRDWISANGESRFQPEIGRYHLYVSLACPWSHRTVLMRKLRGLENVISMSVTNPVWGEAGWCFGGEPGATTDFVNHKRDVIELYRMVDPSFSEPETVPILWDKKTATIVNNESRDIMRMLDREFRDLGNPAVNLCPDQLREKIDETIDRLYAPVNNGVYRAGFARAQRPYERNVKALFDALDEWEAVLAGRRYVCGEVLTEADLALFVTLIRFDVVYYTHFKCNLKRIVDYPNLWGWLRDVYQHPGVADTCDFSHIKNHYFGSHREINPLGIVPLGPVIDLSSPHGRERRFG